MEGLEALDLAVPSTQFEFFCDVEEVLANENDETAYEDPDFPMQTIDVELLTQGDLEEDSSYIPMGTSFDNTTTHDPSPDDIHETQTTEAASSEPPTNPTCDPRTDQPEADTESVDPDARSGGGALLVQRPDSVSPAVTVQAEPTDLATTIGSSSTATLQQTSMQPNIEVDREDTGCVELEGTNVDGSAPTGEEGSSVAAAVVGASESAPLLPTQAVAQPSTTLETAILISDSALIPNLSVKELKAQCKLRRIAQSGNKADLQTKLFAHISEHPSFVVADPSIAFDDLGARVDVATTTRAATRAPVPAWTDRKKLGAGVCRASGRGLPSCVVQEIATKKADLEAAVGTIKVARFADFKTLAFSIYDAKLVHFMSTHHSCVKEIVKTRKIWDVNESRKVDLEFKRLNAIDDYNHHMNGLDICDQLRNQYRMDGIWQRSSWKRAAGGCAGLTPPWSAGHEVAAGVSL
ncbi:hypothetical protein CYMTET_31411 [Cymbomonas tetramitiformis]|uniref:SAP domain-containing protein n=1 Tax=Cymbomonas tetramitiformis TaxID=36881 RepID=A0AAE0FH30_9CHLO|nr:hypothetical protein CYMTET_31411 [Cymbomonas tetramitiformis]